MDEETIIAAHFTRLLLDVDALQFESVRDAFAETVDIKHRSPEGSAVLRIPADALIASWQSLLPGFDATQHITGPAAVEVDGNRATACAAVRSYHFLRGASGGDEYLIAGRYRTAYVRNGGDWRIDGLDLLVSYERGNRKLLSLARARVAAGNLRRPID